LIENISGQSFERETIQLDKSLFRANFLHKYGHQEKNATVRCREIFPMDRYFSGIHRLYVPEGQVLTSGILRNSLLTIARSSRRRSLSKVAYAMSLG
jgi:hypothetical protein